MRNLTSESVLTARELALMIRLSGIDLNAVPESSFDSIRKGECDAVFVGIMSCTANCAASVNEVLQ